jgi:hypothetical protein
MVRDGVRRASEEVMTMICRTSLYVEMIVVGKANGTGIPRCSSSNQLISHRIGVLSNHSTS